MIKALNNLLAWVVTYLACLGWLVLTAVVDAAWMARERDPKMISHANTALLGIAGGIFLTVVALWIMGGCP